MATVLKSRYKSRGYRAALMEAEPLSRPLLETKDYGAEIVVDAKTIGAAGDRWIEPFFAANEPALKRLDLHAKVQAERELKVLLTPGSQIGAIPLLSPATRKVVAGLLVKPRFEWNSLGAVFNKIGFSVEPVLGGAPLVPGSAREVPPWILAGPVITRVAGLLQHRRRGFVHRTETRQCPRGQVQWTSWARSQVPAGKWDRFPCCFSEPDDDPDLIAAVRWTLLRLEDELRPVAASLPGRYLLQRAEELLSQIGPGAIKHPSFTFGQPAISEWIASAIEAMTWVAEERGLGGAKTLDGLAWDISIEKVWEAWVASFAEALARQLGMTASPFGAARRVIHWQGPIHSMGSLRPDVELRGQDRVVWIDAKYKRHLEQLASRGWTGMAADFREEHRADLHQALAYASLADVPEVDTLLVYPQPDYDSRSPKTVATVTSGRRRVRLILASIPFGYRNPDQEVQSLTELRDILRKP